MTTLTKTEKKARNAWYMYDVGNSAYAAVVLLAVYSAYFEKSVAKGHDGTFLWGVSVAIAMTVVAIISPFLGAIADYTATKKRFLAAFTAMAIIFTALLFFVGEGDIFIGMLFFILAEIGYRAAQVFYNSLLPQIADEDEIGTVSGTGWAWGSLGGVVCLIIILALIQLVDHPMIVRFSFLITAGYFAAFSLPIFKNLKEKGEAKEIPPGDNYLSIATKQIAKTIRTARQFKEYLKFMVSFLVYNDGIMMALNFAAIIGAVVFGLSEQGLIIFVIIVQVTNIFGAYAFGKLVDKIGAKPTLYSSILVMLVAVGWLYLGSNSLEFYIIGAVAGFAMAGLQSVSRTMVSVLSPAGQSAEFFGLFAFAGRTSSFLGPLIYGIVFANASRRYLAEGLAENAAKVGGHRIAVLSIGLFFIVGFILLLFVDEQGVRQMKKQPKAVEVPN